MSRKCKQGRQCHSMFFFQKSPKIFQITILKLKFYANNSKQFKFQAQNSNLVYFYFGKLKNKSQFLKKSHLYKIVVHSEIFNIQICGVRKSLCTCILTFLQKWYIKQKSDYLFCMMNAVKFHVYSKRYLLMILFLFYLQRYVTVNSVLKWYLFLSDLL